MEAFNREQHWQQIYEHKALTDVSWYQPRPETSLAFVAQHNLPPAARIIDIGGGDSFFADALLELGYKDITVLDISAAAIRRAQKRLGDRAANIKWIVADIVSFKPPEQYDFWHDRAAFHFLTEERDISAYIQAAAQGLSPEGTTVIGTFSEQGPQKCSGIPIRQYTASSMAATFAPVFEQTSHIIVDHNTPFGTTQNFVWCCFKKAIQNSIEASS